VTILRVKVGDEATLIGGKEKKAFQLKSWPCSRKQIL